MKSSTTPAQELAAAPHVLREYSLIADGERATCETRRGAITIRAMVVTTIRPDTVFIPYHWPGAKSANRLTVAAQDPVSRIPQYKVCGCRVRPADGPPEWAGVLEPQQ